MVPDEQGIFYILVVSGGPGAGEFIYDASGNLRSANVGQVTTDPVQGITCQQGFSTFNGHGAVINLLSTSKGAFFQYQDLGSSTQGSMILVVASTAGTDPVTGFTYQAGMTGVDPAFGDSITTVGANIGLVQALFSANANITANTGSGATSPFIHVAGPEQGHAGHGVIRVYGVSADGTVPGGVIVSTTDPPVRAAAALLEIQGSEVLTGIATPGGPPAGNALLFADTRGFLRTLAGLAGDTDTYGAARLLQQVSPRSQSITSTTGANIGGLSKAVGIGTYIVRARLIIEWNAAAGTPQMRFAGPAVSQMDVSFKSQQSGTNSNANDANTVSAAAGNGTGYNGGLINVTGAMTAAGIFFDMDIWGMFTFTAAGTLTLQAATTFALDPFIVLSGFWEVLPL